MKRYIRSTTSKLEPINIADIDIVSLVLVDDLDSYNPRDSRIYGASTKKVDYSTLTKEQLLQLPKKELSKIHDIRILRKLDKDDLTLDQRRDVLLANQENFLSTKADVKEALAKIKKCHKIYIWDTEKNDTFIDKIYKLGGQVTDKDAANIVSQLHVKDYSYSTWSYLDFNWNNILMVFGYNNSYTFDPVDDNSAPVTVNNLEIYIKLDVDKQTRKGYAAMSFHSPEFPLKFPYADYPTDKE